MSVWLTYQLQPFNGLETRKGNQQTEKKKQTTRKYRYRSLSTIYTVGHKKGATFIFTITLANVDRFQ